MACGAVWFTLDGVLIFQSSKNPLVLLCSGLISAFNTAVVLVTPLALLVVTCGAWGPHEEPASEASRSDAPQLPPPIMKSAPLLRLSPKANHGPGAEVVTVRACQ